MLTAAGAAWPHSSANVPRWPPASLPCAITASAPSATARRASPAVVTIATSARRPRASHGDRRRIVERRDRARARGQRASMSAAGGSAFAGSGGSSGSPSSRRNGRMTARMRSRSPVAGVGGASWALIPIGPSGASARARARSRSSSASEVMPEAPNTPRPPARVTAATSSAVPGPLAIAASRIGTRMPSRSQSGVCSASLTRCSIRPRC